MMRGDTVPIPAEKTIADTYTYLLGRMLVIRQEHMDRKGDGFAYNAIKYNPLGSADFVNPNLDVAYLRRGSRSMRTHRPFSKCRRSRAATTPPSFSTSGVR